jgi:hypothetical protein
MHMAFGGESDTLDEERPISLGEASDILRRFDLSEHDVPLARVSTTSPTELEQLAAEKKQITEKRKLNHR